MDTLKEMEKGNILPVYLFCGSERCLMEEALKKVESLVVEAATRPFNYDLFYGTETTAETITGVARTVPMMARRRLVVVKEADKLSPAGMEELAGYIKAPSPLTCLVLVAEKADMRKGFFQALKGSTVNFKPPYENQMPQWIKREAESRGKRITPQAVQYMSEVVGNDLLKLRNEMEKAALYSADGKEIGLSDVEAVSAKGRLKTIFELTDAVGAKDRVKALEVFGELSANGENSVYVLYMVTRHLRLIWKVKELSDAGKRPEAVGKELGIQPFLLKGMISQAGRFSSKELKDIFMRLLDADASLKSGKLTDRIVIGQLLLSLGNGPMVKKP